MKSKIYILNLVIVTSLIFLGCKKDNPNTGIAPTSNFDVYQAEINENETAGFINKSSADVIDYLWDFGDGNTDTAKNPVHKYEKEGKYTISLTVKNNYGSNKETKKDLITVVKVKTPPIADFVVDNTLVTKNMTIKFNDKSINSPTTWLWDFGDGTTSVFESPFHIYSNSGTYTIKLTVSNEFGTDIKTKTNLIKVSGDTPNVTDYDGNVYNSVQIGTQIWMKQNLKTTHYADGTSILNVTSNSDWANLGTNDKAYCYYNNSITNKDVYGALYTHAAATNGDVFNGVQEIQGVCPDGWHISSKAEWQQLIDYLSEEQSKKLKEEGIVHWANSGYLEGNNISKFTALPGGCRNASDGSFVNLTYFAYWWLANKKNSINGESVEISYLTSFYLDNIAPGFDNYQKNLGFSVRCVKD